jgi:hypothetical protein
MLKTCTVGNEIAYLVSFHIPRMWGVFGKVGSSNLEPHFKCMQDLDSIHALELTQKRCRYQKLAFG